MARCLSFSFKCDLSLKLLKSCHVLQWVHKADMKGWQPLIYTQLWKSGRKGCRLRYGMRLKRATMLGGGLQGSPIEFPNMNIWMINMIRLIALFNGQIHTPTFLVVTHLTYLLLHPAAYVAECEQSNWYNNNSRQITVLGNFVFSSNLMVTSFAVNSIPFWSRSELITGNLLNYWPVTGCIIWVWRFKTYTTLNVSMIHTRNIWSGP